MTREDFDAALRLEVDKLIERDLRSFTVYECVASWAHELTDKLRQSVIVMPCMRPDGTIGVIAYAVPVPASAPYPDRDGPASPT